MARDQWHRVEPFFAFQNLPFVKRYTGLSAPRDLVSFFVAGMARDRRGGWLSIATRKIRLMRVW